MKGVENIHTRYGMGSTGYHTAFPARMSDGGSGGMPLGKNVPSLLKPAVLATGFPDPSHGTPGTAISAHIPYPGAAPSRLRGRGGGMAFFGKLEQAQALLYRKYLALPFMALTCALMLHYLRLVITMIDVDRGTLVLAPALPYGVFHRVVHDRKEALFRRGAVCLAYGSLWHGIPILPRFGQPAIRLTSYHSNLNGSVSG